MAKKRRNKYKFLQKKFPKDMQKKLVILFGGVVLAFAGLIIRITYISAAEGDTYTKIVLDQQQYSSRLIPYKRGDILDTNNTKLATSERVYNVILDAKVLLDDTSNVEQTKEVLEQCFEIQAADVAAALEEKPNSRYIILKKGVSYDKAKEFEACEDDNKTYPNLSGVWLEEDYVRNYPYNSLAADVIGFTSSGNVGNGGIENEYNDLLNGTDGREYGYQNSDASLERVVKEAVNGKSVVSTIDLNIQSMVEQNILEFNRQFEKYDDSGNRIAEGSLNTAVIVMNPNTGAILAEASYPGFDLNKPRDLTQLYTAAEIAAMSDEDKIAAMQSVWKNFCVTDTYEPGSTFKPFTVAAGLETGIITGDETYECSGFKWVSGQKIQCHNTSGHGTQTVEQAIANSCNVALMDIGEALGVDKMIKYQSVFGFGQYTGIDLPGEALGLLYSAENMKEIDLECNAFGQNLNVTMTQMMAGFSSLINGGNYYEPYIVKQIQDENGNVLVNQDPVLAKKTISKKTSTKLKTYMKAVVDYGTGQKAAVEGYDIGGKTGTAQKLPREANNYLLSFIGYAPQENPEVAIYVIIDQPNIANQEDSSLVTGLAHDIMEDIFPYMNITRNSADAQTPDDTQQADDEGSDDSYSENSSEDMTAE